MDKIEKALRRLNTKERLEIKEVLIKVDSGNLKGLDVKKLKGRDDIFRVRKGGLRIIYRLENKKIFILSIDRRHENTYKI